LANFRKNMFYKTLFSVNFGLTGRCIPKSRTIFILKILVTKAEAGAFRIFLVVSLQHGRIFGEFNPLLQNTMLYNTQQQTNLRIDYICKFENRSKV